MPAPVLTFLAPPSTGHDEDGATALSAPEPRPGSRGATREGRAPAALRMTRGAREAAAGMKISDADIQRCLDAADDVSPDPETPSRTRFRRGNLVVLAGGDGMVLRVGRRGR